MKVTDGFMRTGQYSFYGLVLRLIKSFTFADANE